MLWERTTSVIEPYPNIAIKYQRKTPELNALE
jgi:hypothetical protein